MAEKVKSDQFANQAVIQCLESAANTLTFKKLESGISLFDKVAWVISRIEYLLSSLDYGYFNASADVLEWALTTNDQLTTLDIVNSALFDYNYVMRNDIGAAATGMIIEQPFMKDFSTLPGGGLIVPPNPIYLGVKGTSLTTAARVTAKIYYTNLPLQPDQYWELVEARRMITSY